MLRKIKPTLANRYHVDGIGLFGSIVRNDFKPDSSDVDIIVGFNQPVGIEFVDLADFLEKALNKKVDIVSRNGVVSRKCNR